MALITSQYPPERPLVTFALFAFNQEKYIREAIEGALSQTYEPLEIVLSDDCSSDQTFQLIQELAEAYEGQHTLRVRQNPKNLGLASHVNTVLNESNGDIIILAAGDDISLPDRTIISVNHLLSNRSATSVLLSADVIDHIGRKVGERRCVLEGKAAKTQTLRDLLTWKHMTFGATRAIRREAFTRFGPLNTDCPTEDTPFLLRSLILGPNILSPHKAVRYRQHERNLSSLASIKKMKISEIYDQYKFDIATALELKLITKDCERELENWMRKDYESRVLKLKLSSNELLSLKDSIKAIQNPAITVNEKRAFMRKYFTAFIGRI